MGTGIGRQPVRFANSLTTSKTARRQHAGDGKTTSQTQGRSDLHQPQLILGVAAHRRFTGVINFDGHQVFAGFQWS
jgi:hypothetical protein